MRTHIIIPDTLIKEVDKLVGPRERSAFFVEAVSREVRQRRLLIAAKKAAGSLKDEDIPGWESSKSAAEWVHNLRRDSDRKLNW